MADWKSGDRCQVVEHDDATRQPKPGGTVLPATVTGVNGAYVAVKAESAGSIPVLGPLYFYADSGWHARDGEFRWRLLPTDEHNRSTDGGK
jgi:hypothetical protein